MTPRDWLASRLIGMNQPVTPGGASYPQWYDGARGQNTLYPASAAPPMKAPQPGPERIDAPFKGRWAALNLRPQYVDRWNRQTGRG